jgi:prolyl oligopeptidase PreP (S9A serine peptidase family)
MPTIGTLGAGRAESEGEELFFCFTSFTMPMTVLRIDLKSNERTIFARAEAGFDTDGIATNQFWFPSEDGTLIAMFVIHTAGASRPTANVRRSYAATAAAMRSSTCAVAANSATTGTRQDMARLADE